MMPSNLRRDSAWGKAHHFGTTSRTSCDHSLAPVPGTSPYKATAASRIGRFRRIPTLATTAFGGEGEDCLLALATSKLDSFTPGFVLQDF
jgi:hypothetical protein